MESLKEPYHLQKKEMKIKMKSFAYVPSEHGGKDFLAKVQGVESFSDQQYFKTVFASGGDLLSEEADLRRAEVEKFNKALVVDSKEFKVNTMVKTSHTMDKYRNILEDPAKKNGIQLSRN